jgi:hypothetical protein
MYDNEKLVNNIVSPMNTKPTVRIYAPEHWGQVERFAKFYSGTFNFTEPTKKAISGVGNHFNKALVFKSLSTRLQPNLIEDQKELQENGFTHAKNSKELTAVIEEIFTELYSSIDCTRKLVFEIHKKCRGLPDSTRKMFQKVRSEGGVKEFPEALKSAFKNTDWFDRLRIIRDELTHLNLGSCHLDKETSKVSYMHHGINLQGKPLIIDDIFLEVDTVFEGVNTFLGSVFHYLNSQLKEDPVFQICGIFFGRVYTRHVGPHDSLGFDGGTCDSHVWFDSPENPRCPFAENCGAYASAKG